MLDSDLFSSLLEFVGFLVDGGETTKFKVLISLCSSVALWTVFCQDGKVKPGNPPPITAQSGCERIRRGVGEGGFWSFQLRCCSSAAHQEAFRSEEAWSSIHDQSVFHWPSWSLHHKGHLCLSAAAEMPADAGMRVWPRSVRLWLRPHVTSRHTHRHDSTLERGCLSTNRQSSSLVSRKISGDDGLDG